MIRTATLATAHVPVVDDTSAFTHATLDTAVFGPQTIGPMLGLYLEGTAANDTIYGTGGNDGIYGLAGDDILHGGAGNDILDGGIGNDILDGGAGADQLIGGDGIDTATYVNASSAVWADLSAGGVTGEAQGDTYSGIENLTGSNFGDILSGNAGDNVINGGAGDDWIIGGAGNDTLIGGTGTNVLNGGAGSDIFTIAKNAGGITTVQDFQFNIDKVALQGFTPADLGSDGMLAHGIFNTNSHGQSQLDWTGSTFNHTDGLFFRDDTHQLIQVDAAQANLYDAVADGTVIATFTNSATIHTWDLLFT